MAAYGWITRKFIRYGEVITEHLAASSVTSAKLASGAVTAAAIASNTIGGSKMANVTPYAADNASPTFGSPLVIPFTFGASTTTINLTMPYKCRVVGVSHLKTNANAATNNTLQVFNGTDAITSAVVLAVSDKVLTVSGFDIDDAFQDIAAGGTLKVTSTKVGGGDPSCLAYVTVVRVA